MYGGDYVSIQIIRKSVCGSKAIYGDALRTAESGTWQTVSDLSVCQEPIPVKNGYMLVVIAKNDLTAHPP
jgi:hypothetical protein